MSRVFVVTKMGILGMEPVAAFTDYQDADDWCDLNDEHFEDPTKATFAVKPFTLNLLDGLTLAEAGEMLGDTEDYRDDDDEDYDD